MGHRFVAIEAGHAAQNLILQAVSLGYGATPVGAFRERQIQKLYDPPEGEKTLYLIPVGKAK